MSYRFGNLFKHQPFVWLSFGVILFVLGASILADIPATQRRITSIEHLPVPSANSIDQLSMVEGRISARMVPTYRDFVAYIREAYRPCRRGSCWTEVERVTPPLLIETPSETIPIFNDTYELSLPGVTFQEASGPSLTIGTERMRGFVVHSPVVAIGYARMTGPSVGLVADELAVGTRTSYVDAQRGYLRSAFLWGGGLFIGATVCCGIAIYQWRKRSHTETNTTVQTLGKERGTN